MIRKLSIVLMTILINNLTKCQVDPDFTIYRVCATLRSLSDSQLQLMSQDVERVRSCVEALYPSVSEARADCWSTAFPDGDTDGDGDSDSGDNDGDDSDDGRRRIKVKKTPTKNGTPKNQVPTTRKRTLNKKKAPNQRLAKKRPREDLPENFNENIRDKCLHPEENIPKIESYLLCVEDALVELERQTNRFAERRHVQYKIAQNCRGPYGLVG